MTSGSKPPAVGRVGVTPASPNGDEVDPGVWVVVSRHPADGPGGGERVEVVAAYTDLRWAMAHVRSRGSSHYLVRAPLDPPL